MLIPQTCYQDFMSRLNDIAELLDKGTAYHTKIARNRFDALELDIDALFARGAIHDVENPGFVERLLEVWQRFQ